MTSPELIQPLLLLQRVAPKPFFDELSQKHKLHRKDGIYTTDVVVWMMIHQRLHSKHTLSAAVQALAGECPTGLLSRCKRVREDRISSRTGGYCQARQKLSAGMAAEVTDHIYQQLRGLMQEGWKGLKRPVLLIDGTTLRLQHRLSLLQAFPPGSNQHGENHWPVLQMVVCHDLFTGLAMRPSWGPMYGPAGVSEQSLAEQSLQRLPADAVLMADTNFGIFSFAYTVQQSGRQMLFRMQQSRAQRILGQKPMPGLERKVVWKASAHDRKAHPEMDQNAQLEGRLLIFQHPSRPSELVCLFTTLDLPAAEIWQMYKLRWNVETDLRSLKQTLGMQPLSSKSLEMMEKELLLGISAYNLVRAVMCLAAQQADCEPRRLSFSQVQDVVDAARPGLTQANTEAQIQHCVDRMLRRAAQCRLPQRPQARSYPREVWGRGGKFPPRRGTNQKDIQ